ncbi:ribonuclease III [Ornithinimicrobium cryptoxanthini]|uniref:Ribonuclease 3 n=1 Tax=Ornithinimicrobium cryptoxanthini TaxID=2934161 RepID=A0ABY4YEK3_9MICO|nr:ribonuclease III [Ornithinimicrobium cryptoxanthini]USQ75208.1 ribonuclease III [Ornithinimicrobium cryptoxanthini]
MTSGSGSGAGTSPATPEQRPLADLQDYLTEVVGQPCDEALLRRAMTHRSYAYENGNLPHNERLEFLGDSVLGLVVTDTLYRRHPDLPEGQLAKLRAAVVNSRALAEVAQTIGLGDFVLLGRGEESTGGRHKASILADTTEAVIGCIYISVGLPAADTFVHHLLDPMMEQSATLGAALDWKTSLQELASTDAPVSPTYQIVEEGPDHDKVFTATAVVEEEVLGTGVGRSKKAAEQKAAEAAWTLLTERATAREDAETAANATANATAGVPGADVAAHPASD